MKEVGSGTKDDRRQRAALVSLAAGSAIFLAKLLGWRLSGSTAVLSDALESVVNVLAAGFAVGAVRFAAHPADRDHPYGHGKIEFVSAAFEGGLITFAALMIVFEATRALATGPGLRSADWGLATTAVAGAGNLALGLWLVRTGRAVRSPTLEADGKHVLSDAWTTAGVLASLALVRLTGVRWLDPLAALGVAVLLAWTGLRLVRDAGAGLLDEQDPALLARLVAAFNQVAPDWPAGLHRLRAQRFGGEVHVEADLWVPEHWPLREAHDRANELGAAIIRAAGLTGEMSFHLDPCRRRRCPHCALPGCADRAEPCAEKTVLTLEDALRAGSAVP